MEHSNINPRQKRMKPSRLFTNKSTVFLQSPLLLRLAEYGIRFFLGAILASGTLLGGCIPFGLGFVGASGPGLSGLFSLLGCCVGYFLTLSLSAALKYVAASILIFAVSFAFFDVRLYKKAWFMPLFTGILTAATGFVYLPEQGFGASSLILFFTEILLAGASAYFYKIAFSPWVNPKEEELTRQQAIAILILCMSILATLSQVELPGHISVGRLLAAFLVMLAALQGGMGKGSAVGVSLGVSMDLAAGGAPFYTMAYGLAGLMSGTVSSHGRFATVASYVIANGVAVLWALGEGTSLSILYEVFIASVLFMIVPERRLFRVGALFHSASYSGGEEEDLPVRTYMKERLEAASAAFRELYEGIRSSFQPNRNVEHDIAVIFDRAASRACRNCPLYNACWQRGYAATFKALCAASKTMLDRGRAETSDFPPHFSKRCMRFSSFLTATNEELTALLCRKRYRNQLLESRMAVCRQYEDLAGILGQTAAQLDTQLHADAQQTRKLTQLLQDLDLDAQCSVFYDTSDHLRVEIEGSGLAVLETDEMQTNLSELLGIPLRPPQRKEGERERIVFTELEPLAAVIGVAARRKENETINGDNGSYFKTDDGILYIILADGMGSGEAAARESNLAIHLLERFLKAGVLPEPALKTLNSALILRSEAEGGFTTIDLLQINLFTGQTDLYKFGAAPSYCLQKQHVRRISGNSIPIGLSTGGIPSPDIAHLHVDSGDCMILVSDGILGGGEDQWLRALIAEHPPGDPPRKLARRILDASEEAVGSLDDKTVMVMAVETRTAKPDPLPQT
ncbi:MAG: SpoIIE family protein phosphatase [Oscillospiraceae bacterium]|jgi:stage II sporulation protein E